MTCLGGEDVVLTIISDLLPSPCLTLGDYLLSRHGVPCCSITTPAGPIIIWTRRPSSLQPRGLLQPNWRRDPYLAPWPPNPAGTAPLKTWSTGGMGSTTPSCVPVTRWTSATSSSRVSRGGVIQSTWTSGSGVPTMWWRIGPGRELQPHITSLPDSPPSGLDCHLE